MPPGGRTPRSPARFGHRTLPLDSTWQGVHATAEDHQPVISDRFARRRALLRSLWHDAYERVRAVSDPLHSAAASGRVSLGEELSASEKLEQLDEQFRAVGGAVGLPTPPREAHWRTGAKEIV